MILRHYKPYSTERIMGSNGRLACLQCNGDITSPRRITFCTNNCSIEFSIKSNPSFARGEVYKRDKGICAKCGKNTMEGFKRKSSKGSGHRWQADHILPVVEGGGSCGLDNLRTLCILCHKEETSALLKRRAEARKLQSISLLDK